MSIKHLCLPHALMTSLLCASCFISLIALTHGHALTNTCVTILWRIHHAYGMYTCNPGNTFVTYKLYTPLFPTLTKQNIFVIGSQDPLSLPHA